MEPPGEDESDPDTKPKTVKPFPLTLELLQHSHLHLQHLFGLLGWLHLQRHVDPRQQIHCLVDLPKATAPDLFHLEKETLREDFYDPSFIRVDYTRRVIFTNAKAYIKSELL